MNKNEAFNQTRRDPKELVEIYKQRFMVIAPFYIEMSLEFYEQVLNEYVANFFFRTNFFCSLSSEHRVFSITGQPHNQPDKSVRTYNVSSIIFYSS